MGCEIAHFIKPFDPTQNRLTDEKCKSTKQQGT